MQSHGKSASMDAGVHMPISGSSLTSSWPSHAHCFRKVCLLLWRQKFGLHKLWVSGDLELCDPVRELNAAFWDMTGTTVRCGCCSFTTSSDVEASQTGPICFWAISSTSPSITPSTRSSLHKAPMAERCPLQLSIPAPPSTEGTSLRAASQSEMKEEPEHTDKRLPASCDFSVLQPEKSCPFW